MPESPSATNARAVAEANNSSGQQEVLQQNRRQPGNDDSWNAPVRDGDELTSQRRSRQKHDLACFNCREARQRCDRYSPWYVSADTNAPHA